VVLMDIGMTGLSSFEATRQIRKARPETRVLFLSMYDDEDYLVESMEAGASGYVLKDSPAQQLLNAIRGQDTPRAALERTAARWREILTQTGYLRE